GTGSAHPLFARKYPDLAKLLTETLRASDPKRRPEPDGWRSVLKSVAETKIRRSRLRSVRLEPYPINEHNRGVYFGERQIHLDLLSPFGIHASLERNADGTVDILIL